MRKRLAIGLLAIVAIGVVAFVVSQPKRGTVEWHKREYLEEWNRANGNTRIDHLKRRFANLTGIEIRGTGPRDANQERLLSNLGALRKLGYLKECRVVLNNSQVDAVIGVMHFVEHDPSRLDDMLPALRASIRNLRLRNYLHRRMT